jgi:hypothetical protein
MFPQIGTIYPFIRTGRVPFMMSKHLILSTFPNTCQLVEELGLCTKGALAGTSSKTAKALFRRRCVHYCTIILIPHSWSRFYPLSKKEHGHSPTLGNLRILSKTDRERDFLEARSKEEEIMGHHSPAFGPDLLPGMYSTPVLAVPKPHSEKPRLCSHMSAGEFSQNNMTDRSETKGARLDTLLHFILAIL